MCVPSMSASGRPFRSSNTAISAWCVGTPVVPGEHGDELRLEDAVDVAGHRGEEAAFGRRGDPRWDGRTALAERDEGVERLEQGVDVEQPAHLLLTQYEHRRDHHPR